MSRMSVGESPPPAATAVRIATSTIAMRSSKIRMPNTIWVTRPRIPCSTSALLTIVVLEIATIPAVKRLSVEVHPSRRPTR